MQICYKIMYAHYCIKEKSFANETLSFDESIEFSVLLEKIVQKLVAAYDYERTDIDKYFTLLIENREYLEVRNTHDVKKIKDGDKIILYNPFPPNKNYDTRMIIGKRFPGGKSSQGELVLNYDHANNRRYYTIKYEDSDKEDLDENDKELHYKRDPSDADDSDVISISSDEDGYFSSGENDIEEEYDSSPSESEFQIKKESEHNEDDNTRRKKRLKRNPKKPIESPLEVIMNARDIPSAPGKSDHRSEDNDEMEEKSLLVDRAGKKKAEQEVKHRIIKLLNTGFHNQSNENEAKNAMKLAQKLMRKHNLSQALLLKEREAKNSQNAEDEEVLKGGMVSVNIVNRKTRKVAVYAQWIARLPLPVCENFGVQYYVSKRRGVRCEVVFYGIYTNAQLAGYAFKVATERIAQMMAVYQPLKYWRDISTKSSRLSYAIGIVEGISEDVEKNLEMEKEQRKRKLERARLAGSKGEAYAESDDEDFGIDNEGPGISIVDEEVGSNNDVSRNSLPPNHVSSGEVKPDPQPRSFSGIDLEHRVEELEKEEQAALVLVDHNEKVAEQVLKEHNISLTTGRRRSSAFCFDNRSYKKGIEDAKEIDLNQRAIRDEVKVKPEKM